MNRAVRKYQRTANGRRNMRLRLIKWRANNRFNRDTITIFKPFPECINCPENYNNCPVENNAENITVCPAWLEYKRTGVHPAKQYQQNEPEYDPENIDFVYTHID